MRTVFIRSASAPQVKSRRKVYHRFSVYGEHFAVVRARKLKTHFRAVHIETGACVPGVLCAAKGLVESWTQEAIYTAGRTKFLRVVAQARRHLATAI